ncbi:hypothetical protein CRE_21548 [Caenorhabditis remanei]|uniref:Tyrosine-protein phosphatase domain-containing protein n=1 Tax=Caenorhabditis remanei TaxID=31234 RepID=E3NCQ2_CAERE|nr:hypothetical protein CRE_21548 [Caenorhabditis remanei]
MSEKFRTSLPNFWAILMLILLLSKLTSSDFPDYVHPRFKMMNVSIPRRRRASKGEKLPSLVDNYQKLARLSNGISLEIGLLDGSIPSETALSEILQMGKATISDIEELDSNVISNGIEEIRKLPTALISTTDVQKLENRLVLLEDVRASATTLKAFASVPVKKTEYDAILEKVKSLDTLKKDLEDFKADVTTLISEFNPIKQSSNLINNESVQKSARRVTIVSSKLEDIETTAGKFNKTIDLLIESKKIVDASKFLDLLFLENEVRSKLRTRIVYEDEKIQLLVFTLQKFHEASARFSGPQMALNSIQQLVEARNHPRMRSIEYTSGLPNGPQDLEKLNTDIDAGWVVERIAESSVVSENLKQSFAQLNGLISLLKTVEQSWSTLQEDSSQHDFGVIRSLGLKLSEVVSEDQTAFSNAISNLKKCDEEVKMYPDHDIKDLNTTSEAVKALNDKISGLPSFGYIDYFKNLATLKTMFDTTGKSEEDTKKIARNVMEKIGKDASLLKFEEHVVILLADLTTTVDIITNAPALTSPINLKSVTDHHNIINIPEYLKIYTCLDDIKMGTKSPVKSTIEFIQELRTIQIPTAPNAIINSVLTSKNDLVTAKTSAEKMKEVKTREALSLKASFPNSLEVSKTLGMAVRGLAAIDKAYESKDRLDTLLQKIDEIVKESTVLAPENQSALSKLVDLKKVFAGIDDFVKEIDEMENIRKKRAIESFKNTGKVLEAADKIPEVKLLDVVAAKNAMEKLNAASSKKYDQESAQLDILEELDLDFARYEFLEAVNSLQALDDFFLNYANAMAAPVPTPAPRVVIPSSTDSSDVQNRAHPETSDMDALEVTTADNSTRNVIIGVVVVFVGVLFSAAASIGGVICWKRNKQEKPLPDVDPDMPEHVVIQGKSSADPAVPAAPEVPAAPDARAAPAADAALVVAPAADAALVVAPAAILPAPVPSDENMLTAIASSVPNLHNEELQPTQWTDEDIAKRMKFIFDTQKAFEDSMVVNVELPNEFPKSYLKYYDTNDERKATAELKEENKNERWAPNRVCLKAHRFPLAGFRETNNFINANGMKFEEYDWWSAQAPTNEQFPGKISTVEKTLAMFVQGNIGVVLMLCEFKLINHEDESYQNCAEYFSQEKNGTMTHGKLTVTTKDRIDQVPDMTFQKDHVLFKLEIEENDTKKKHAVDVLLTKDWLEKSSMITPLSVISKPKCALDIIRFADSYKSNVCVMSKHGTGRAGTIMAIKNALHLLETHETITLYDIIEPVRAVRFGAVENELQLFFVIVTVAFYLLEKANLACMPSYDFLDFFHARFYQADFERYAPLTNRDKKWKSEAYKDRVNLLRRYVNEAKTEAIKISKKNPNNGTTYEFDLTKREMLKEWDATEVRKTRADNDQPRGLLQQQRLQQKQVATKKTKREKQEKTDVGEEGEDPKKTEESKKNPSKKEASRKEASKKNPSKKNPSKKEASKKEKSKKNPSRKEASKKGAKKEESKKKK